ncbi:hypothetical protein PG911_10480 [Tenacibaculum ovolyticum]|uniref:hypothetical protein n=1 Tax=Tenacibaculum ovolyticum TaxID=104270 RepID=UPI0022F38E46|nr:hypothetical protein [Tenacibaculum ovolyticum]WBX75083.1 hypothetical protein PG911_10480 [Tenacibaculum ovolyticum]
MKKNILCILFFLTQLFVAGQEITQIKIKLDKLSEIEPGLNELVQINVSQVSLYNFVIALSDEHKLNVSIDESLDQNVINNFYNVKVKDVFLFLVSKYDLEIQFLNRIIILNKKRLLKRKKRKEVLMCLIILKKNYYR